LPTPSAGQGPRTGPSIEGRRGRDDGLLGTGPEQRRSARPRANARGRVVQPGGSALGRCRSSRGWASAGRNGHKPRRRNGPSTTVVRWGGRVHDPASRQGDAGGTGRAVGDEAPFVPPPGPRPGGMYWRTWRSLCGAPTSARTIRIQPYGTGSNRITKAASNQLSRANAAQQVINLLAQATRVTQRANQLVVPKVEGSSGVRPLRTAGRREPTYFCGILRQTGLSHPRRTRQPCSISHTNQTKKPPCHPTLHGATDSSSIQPFCPVLNPGGAS
jgi:hypothetical protein